MTTFNESLVSVTSDMAHFTFNAYDYMVFVVMLAISSGIGVYFGFFANGADTTEEYLLGGKRMKTIPIAISLVASQLSGISIMTIPAEIYSFGINWFFNVCSMIFIVPFLIWVIIPVFYNNNISNCYEYLQMRFDRKTREILTVLFMGTLFLMLPVFIFIPSLAFSQVTGINIHLINTVVCSICVFYTMFGGIKAVVWTDVIQGTIMVISVVSVCIIAIFKIGGFSKVFTIALEGKRLDIDFTFDATTRSTFWNNFLNSIIMWSSYVGLNQSCVQRIVSLPTLGHAKRALVIFGFGFLLIMFFNCLTGIVMYARFYDCDPIAAGHVLKADKLMPFFVQDVVGDLTGMPGVFISCVFSAALSTISASLNSLSGVVYFDYIKPRVKHTEHKANCIMKIMILVAGVYCILAGTIVEKFTSILQITYSIGGLSFGPVFGTYLMGMLVPRAHGKAVFWANICSIAMMAFIVFGAQGHNVYAPLPVSTEGCKFANHSAQNIASNISTLLNLSTQQGHHENHFDIFALSFNWYVVLGTVIFFAVGIPLSYILTPSPDYKLNPKLLSPIVQSLVKYELAHVDEVDESELKTKINGMQT